MKTKMTFVLIIINLAGIVNSCQGQSYHKFIEQGKYWEVIHMYYPNICGMSGGERSFFDRDTIISGVNYSILSAYPIVNVNPGPFCPPLAVDTSIKFDIAILREDTISKRIYKHDLSSITDNLLFEFGLNVGDTLSTYQGLAPKYIVDSVGVITLLDGTTRPVYFTTGNQNQLEFVIEGIGGSRGPYDVIEIALDGEDFLTCYSESGINIWGNNLLYGGTSLNCLGLVGINDDIKNTTALFNISNINGCLFIRNLTNENGQLCLNEISGKSALEERIYKSESNINVNTLSPGIYVYNFTTDSKLRFTGKLILY
ncbi:MAG: hypothetical protein IPN13_00030 [Bacteroidetes bacterium]|nr:hypothetical protein [Bacteroidota bacterium]MBK8872371.1 hypothetical protein [Bacteroidota bacterium]MBK9048647.1 hypothetical protein [Bacteroidota bacterium]